MYNNKQIIVSMTSWKQRIQFVPKIIFMMEKQTIIPDKIILNLSSDEFPNKEKDLPQDLVLLSSTLNNFEIFWVKENTRAFKKFIPTLKRYFKNDCWILTVDDDYFYNNNYIQMMINNAEKNYPNCITPGKCGAHPHGYAMIYHPSMFKNGSIFDISLEEMNKIIASDNWIQGALYSNNLTFIKVPEILNYIKETPRPARLGALYANKSHDNFRKTYITELFKKLGYDIKF